MTNLRFREPHEEWIHEIKLARIREQPKVSSDQLERGKGIEIGTNSSLDSLYESFAE